MQSQNGNFFTLIAERERKDKRPRIMKAYKMEKEYYPWRVAVFPAVFPVIGFFIFMKSAADFSKDFKFGGIFYLILALIFVGMGAIFYFGYPCGNEIGSWKRFREKVKTARNRGARYQGEITGYKVTIARWVGDGKNAPEAVLNYVLEVEFLEDTKYKTVEIPAFRYHPNAVLKGNRCKVYAYEGNYYVGDFELRTGMQDKTTEIPMKGLTG